MPMTRRQVGLFIATALCAPAIIKARGATPFRIGVLNNMTGPYAGNGGMGSVVAANLAKEDFGESVLDRPIEILSADHQNKPDIAASIAREWIDTKGVTAFADGAASSCGLAIQQIARERRCLFLISGSTSSDFTGKACSPFGFHFVADTYAFAHGSARALTRLGGKTWFFITADYAFGHALERDATDALMEAGGQVLGAVRHPLGTTEFGSFLTQAKASGAQVVAFANAGTDLQNALKQAAEFGIVQGGQRLASLLMFISDTAALGLEIAHGLTLTTSFYHDIDDATRAWTKRFVAQKPQPPTMTHAGTYSGVLHYLRGVQTAETVDGVAVSNTMRKMPVNDFFNNAIRIRDDGRVLERVFLMEVKSPQESKYQYDFYKLLSTTPGEEAFRPMINYGCSKL